MEKPCLRCKKLDHPSNLIGMIGGMTCFSCQEKNLRLNRKMLPVIDIFSSIYKILPVICGVIGLLYLFLTPTLYIILIILLILTICFTFVSIFGMLPHIFPAFSNMTLEEMELKFKTQKEKYYPGTPSFCVYHSEREAIARCLGCFAPFCAEHFIYLLKNPTVCKNCASTFIVQTNLYAMLNGILSVGFLSSVGIFIEVTVFGGFMLSFVFVIFLIIMIAIVIFFAYYTKQLRSQSPTLPSSIS